MNEFVPVTFFGIPIVVDENAPPGGLWLGYDPQAFVDANARAAERRKQTADSLVPWIVWYSTMSRRRLPSL